MPNLDGTGPRGEGRMTGCGRGYCVVPVSAPKEELGYLESQERALQVQLSQTRARIRAVKALEKDGNVRS